MPKSFADRLEQAMIARRMNMRELSVAAGGSLTLVRDIIKRGMEPKLDTASALARALGMSLSELVDGEFVPLQSIPIIGAVSAGEGWSPIDDGLGEILMEVDGDAVALEVRGDSMSPVYNAGDVLIGGRRTGANIMRLIGKDCIVLTEAGDRYLKFIVKSAVRGRFNLRSHNPAHADIESIAITWAAPILWVKRAV